MIKINLLPEAEAQAYDPHKWILVFIVFLVAISISSYYFILMPRMAALSIIITELQQQKERLPIHTFYTLPDQMLTMRLAHRLPVYRNELPKFLNEIGKISQSGICLKSIIRHHSEIKITGLSSSLTDLHQFLSSMGNLERLTHVRLHELEQHSNVIKFYLKATDADALDKTEIQKKKNDGLSV